MKKPILKLACLTVALTAGATALSSCALLSGNKGADGDLIITYYKGGYGSQWIEYIVEEFEKEKGISVSLLASDKLHCGADTNINSGRDISDIYISASSPWNSWVSENKIESLADVYEAEVSTENGKVKIKDYIDQDVIGKFYMQRRAGQGEFEPWVLPWSAQPNALAYNEDLLLKVVHTSSAYTVEGLAVGEKWTAPPKTVTELMAYIADVNAYSDNSGYKYVPFGWAGKTPETFFYMIYNWWAQAQGVKTSNYDGEGSFFDFWNFGNTKTGRQDFDFGVFEQSGIVVAIDTLRDIVVKDGSYINTLSRPTSLTAQELQKVFVSSEIKTKPAIVLASSYLEYETSLSGSLDSNKDGEQDVNFKFMPVPALDSYTGNKTVYCTYEDVIFIPKGASHKDLAKEFLVYMTNQDMLDYFSKETGSIRPFNYDARQSSDKHSAFTQSVMDVYYNSTHLFEYPLNVDSMDKVSYVYRFERPTLFGVTPLGTVLSDLKTLSGADLIKKSNTYTQGQVKNTWQKTYVLTMI